MPGGFCSPIRTGWVSLGDRHRMVSHFLRLIFCERSNRKSKVCLQDETYNRVMYRHITQGLTLECEGCLGLKGSECWLAWKKPEALLLHDGNRATGRARSHNRLPSNLLSFKSEAEFKGTALKSHHSLSFPCRCQVVPLRKDPRQRPFGLHLCGVPEKQRADLFWKGRVLLLPPKLMDEEGRPEVQLLEPDEDTAAAWVLRRRLTSKKPLGPRSQDAQPQVRVQPGWEGTRDHRGRDHWGWEKDRRSALETEEGQECGSSSLRVLQQVERQCFKELESYIQENAERERGDLGESEGVFWKSQKEPTRGKPALLSERESLMRNLEASRPVTWHVSCGIWKSEVLPAR